MLKSLQFRLAVRMAGLVALAFALGAPRKW